MAPIPDISDAFTGTRLNDPVSEVDVTKYQQAFLAPLPGISEVLTKTRLNDLVSEVDVTKYQQAFLAPLPGKAQVNCVGKVMNKREMEYSFAN